MFKFWNIERYSLRMLRLLWIVWWHKSSAKFQIKSLPIEIALNKLHRGRIEAPQTQHDSTWMEAFVPIRATNIKIRKEKKSASASSRFSFSLAVHWMRKAQKESNAPEQTANHNTNINECEKKKKKTNKRTRSEFFHSVFCTQLFYTSRKWNAVQNTRTPEKKNYNFFAAPVSIWKIFIYFFAWTIHCNLKVHF